MVRGFGQTLLTMKTWLRDVCRAMHRGGLCNLPADYFHWGPPGPGCRRGLDRMDYSSRAVYDRAVRSTSTKRARLQAARNAPATSETAADAVQRLHMVHSAVQASGVLPELETLLGHPCGVHETQAGLCAFVKYLELRAAVEAGEPMPSSVRWCRTPPVAWPERHTGLAE